MIHGDANVGNALLDAAGRAVLIDLGGLALRPREWDLTLTAMYFERFEWHTRTAYEAFVRACGFDIMDVACAGAADQPAASLSRVRARVSSMAWNCAVMAGVP